MHIVQKQKAQHVNELRLKSVIILRSLITPFSLAD